ncbi:hypothetical protein [Fodinicola feengrottensis]|uniref:hypothetical protein n=1 Tax=Fodinicola feengrottensis TaxID=435914 RepID=UPI0013D7CEED|nr:hypothetical protein [Fodinicola feengrottensis]
MQAKPIAGRWEIDVVLNLTTSGNEFTQTVKGTVGYNGSAVGVYALPTNPTATIAAGSSKPVSLRVTNPAGVGRSFRLTSATGDVTGGAVSTPIYLAAGMTALFTANVVPVAAPGTAVQGYALRGEQHERTQRSAANRRTSVRVHGRRGLA